MVGGGCPFSFIVFILPDPSSFILFFAMPCFLSFHSPNQYWSALKSNKHTTNFLDMFFILQNHLHIGQYVVFCLPGTYSIIPRVPVYTHTTPCVSSILNHSKLSHISYIHTGTPPNHMST